MIFVTGDTHADFKYRFTTESFPEQKEMTKNDYIIICGDFGGVWDIGWESKNEKYWLDWFENRSYTLLFVDGNHENFDRLNGYPVKEWHGGKVHELRPHVLHLMRGQVFDIDGKKFFTFGGARSHDIDGGILETDDPDFKEKKKELDRECACYRINHLSWWKEEMPSKEEMNEGLDNLIKNDFRVDFIITHDMPASTLALFSHGSYKPDNLNKFLETVRSKTEYKRWFCGHYHDNKYINDKDILLYEQLIRII